jgi:hypothetical protein
LAGALDERQGASADATHCFSEEHGQIVAVRRQPAMAPRARLLSKAPSAILTLFCLCFAVEILKLLIKTKFLAWREACYETGQIAKAPGGKPGRRRKPGFVDRLSSRMIAGFERTVQAE